MNGYETRSIPDMGPVEQKLPHDSAAELAVLGSIVLDRDAIISVADLLQVDDFYQEKHRHIYGAMLHLYEQHTPQDGLLVISELERRGQLEAIGGRAYLTNLVSYVPTAAHVTYYARRIAETAMQRRCIGAGALIAGMGYEGRESSDVLMSDAMRAVMNMAAGRTSAGDYSSMTDLANEFVDGMDREETPGIMTGLEALDQKLGGLQKSDLIIMAARPGFGKTSLALQIALYAATHGHHVGVFELEMPKRQLMERMIANDTGLDGQAVRLHRLPDAERSRATASAGKLAALPIMVEDRVPLDIMSLRTKSNRMKAYEGLDLLIVDYLQLMRVGDSGTRKHSSREEEVAEVSRSLKQIAKELDVPVIACAQMNRAIENRSGPPHLSDLRESGSIEADADIVLFLHNETGAPLQREGTIDVHIAKQRNGPLGVEALYYDPSCMRFRDTWGTRYEED